MSQILPKLPFCAFFASLRVDPFNGSTRGLLFRPNPISSAMTQREANVRWQAAIALSYVLRWVDSTTILIFGAKMLRLQVETCKWQCLLCNREFLSKFCYLLHVKSVHDRSKEHESNEDLVRPLVEEGANCSSTSIDAVVERSFEENGPKPISHEGNANNGPGDLTCGVCKKTYSSSQRLAHHKKLHVNAIACASKNQKRKMSSQKLLLKNSKTKFKKSSLLAGH